FISESVGPGRMKYDAIVVPNLRTIRSSTLDLLEAALERGGTVIFAGSVPALVDAKPSKRAVRLAKRCQRVQMNRREILQALEPFREIDIRLADGSRCDSILHQFRVDGRNRHLFLCNTDRHTGRRVQIRIAGKWNVTLLDTMSGKTKPLHSVVAGKHTLIPH